MKVDLAATMRSDAKQDTVTIIHDATGRRARLPVVSGSQGPQVIDIRGLYQGLGMFTYDPGYLATASCRSEITYIDGDAGELLYRGYPIEQLATGSSYLEVCYLLQYGHLPTPRQLAVFDGEVRRHRWVPEGLQRFYFGFPRDAHPMAIMVSVVGALSAFYHGTLDIGDRSDRERFAHHLLGKIPTLAAYSYRYATGAPFLGPGCDRDYVASLLHMMFGDTYESAALSEQAVRALELILILHADHEQNASASTVRLAGSSGTNPFASIAAGIGSLWGPAHGGANEAVVRMLQSIESVREVRTLVARAKDKHEDFRLHGFGHRVYRNHDPRARIIREVCHDLLHGLCATNRPLFEIALELERIALEDDYFRERKLYPNVDFYSGIILSAIGVPLNMFTVIFAVARTAGWAAQWMELMEDPEYRIGRPRQLYTGQRRRNYVPLELR